MDRDPELPNYDLPINSISVVLSDGKKKRRLHFDGWIGWMTCDFTSFTTVCQS